MQGLFCCELSGFVLDYTFIELSSFVFDYLFSDGLSI